ncbi:MAG: hypothetical protein ACRDV9_10910 [Acidimicrobiia bacterium]
MRPVASGAPGIDRIGISGIRGPRTTPVPSVESTRCLVLVWHLGPARSSGDFRVARRALSSRWRVSRGDDPNRAPVISIAKTDEVAPISSG